MATKKREYKIGDEVETYLTNSSKRGKKKVRGKIKSIQEMFGKKFYVITGGVVEDFKTVNIK